MENHMIHHHRHHEPIAMLHPSENTVINARMNNNMQLQRRILSAPHINTLPIKNTSSMPPHTMSQHTMHIPSLVLNIASINQNNDNLNIKTESMESMDESDSENPFQCLECGKRYKQLSSLGRHRKKMHSGKDMKSHECRSCGSKFHSKYQLTVHYRTHTNERPYECKLCPEKFRQNSHLLTHLRTHTGEKPYECRVCHKKFTQSSSVTTHMRIHDAIKPYACPHCLQQFTQKHSRDRHIRAKHLKAKTEKDYQCKNKSMKENKQMIFKQDNSQNTNNNHRNFKKSKREVRNGTNMKMQFVSGGFMNENAKIKQEKDYNRLLKRKPRKFKTFESTNNNQNNHNNHNTFSNFSKTIKTQPNLCQSPYSHSDSTNSSDSSDDLPIIPENLKLTTKLDFSTMPVLPIPIANFDLDLLPTGLDLNIPTLPVRNTNEMHNNNNHNNCMSDFGHQNHSSANHKNTNNNNNNSWNSNHKSHYKTHNNNHQNHGNHNNGNNGNNTNENNGNNDTKNCNMTFSKNETKVGTNVINQFNQNININNIGQLTWNGYHVTDLFFEWLQMLPPEGLGIAGIPKHNVNINVVSKMTANGNGNTTNAVIASNQPNNARIALKSDVHNDNEGDYNMLRDGPIPTLPIIEGFNGKRVMHGAIPSVPEHISNHQYPPMTDSSQSRSNSVSSPSFSTLPTLGMMPPLPAIDGFNGNNNNENGSNNDKNKRNGDGMSSHNKIYEYFLNNLSTILGQTRGNMMNASNANINNESKVVNTEETRIELEHNNHEMDLLEEPIGDDEDDSVPPLMISLPALEMGEYKSNNISPRNHFGDVIHSNNEDELDGLYDANNDDLGGLDMDDDGINVVPHTVSLIYPFEDTPLLYVAQMLPSSKDIIGKTNVIVHQSQTENINPNNIDNTNTDIHNSDLNHVEYDAIMEQSNVIQRTLKRKRSDKEEVDASDDSDEDDDDEDDDEDIDDIEEKKEENGSEHDDDDGSEEVPDLVDEQQPNVNNENVNTNGNGYTNNSVSDVQSSQNGHNHRVINNGNSFTTSATPAQTMDNILSRIGQSAAMSVNGTVDSVNLSCNNRSNRQSISSELSNLFHRNLNGKKDITPFESFLPINNEMNGVEDTDLIIASLPPYCQTVANEKDWAFESITREVVQDSAKVKEETDDTDSIDIDMDIKEEQVHFVRINDKVDDEDVYHREDPFGRLIYNIYHQRIGFNTNYNREFDVNVGVEYFDDDEQFDDI